MTKFCIYCDNLLIEILQNNILIFKCPSCYIPYNLNPEDTLLYERTKESDVMIFEKILKKAVFDPATIKTYKDCIVKDCKSKIVKQVRIGEDMRLYNICTICHTQWLN